MDGHITEDMIDGSGPVEVGFDDDGWARELLKNLAPAARLFRDVTVSTIFGAYELDLVVELGALRVGFNCRPDAVPGPTLVGMWRDAGLVGGGDLFTVYRLRPVDLANHPADCLYAMSRADPRLFSRRGHVNLDRLASDTIRFGRFPREEVLVYYPQGDEEDDADPSGDPADVCVEPRPRETGETLHLLRRDRPQLRRWFELARSYGARTAEQAMAWFAAEQLGPR